MDRVKLGSGIVLVLFVVWLAGILVSLASSSWNGLFLDSAYQTEAAATLAFLLVVIVAYAAIGTPWSRWKRTAYW